MNRNQFIATLSAAGIIIFLPKSLQTNMNDPKKLFFADDGKIPNSKLPLILYKNAFTARSAKGALWLEQKFAENNWTNSWRNGIYAFHHYHSTTYEVLGVYER